MHHSIKHGCYKTDEYHVWQWMKSRCTNPNVKQYKDWGGRGIIVCQRWMESFSNFLEDMGKKPSKNHTLDRINNDGNYEPTNCRWATRSEQKRNVRNNRIIEIDGVKKPMIEWLEYYNMNQVTVWHRLKRGWNIKDSFTKESRERIGNVLFVTINGDAKPLKEWCKIYKVNHKTVSGRIHRGKSPIDALLTPLSKNQHK